MSHNHKSNNTQNVNYISTYFYAYLPTAKMTSTISSKREYKNVIKIYYQNKIKEITPNGITNNPNNQIFNTLI